jgi:hypothetical protein
MKSFAALPTSTVTLRRQNGTGPDGAPVYAELAFELRPWPIGFPEMLSRVFPMPVLYVNAKPAGPDPARADEHQADRLCILLATCLGPELTAKAPGPSGVTADWTAYAKAIRAEFEAACLVEGDVSVLMAAAYALNQGQSRPKA